MVCKRNNNRVDRRQQVNEHQVARFAQREAPLALFLPLCSLPPGVTPFFALDSGTALLGPLGLLVAGRLGLAGLGFGSLGVDGALWGEQAAFGAEPEALLGLDQQARLHAAAQGRAEAARKHVRGGVELEFIDQVLEGKKRLANHQGNRRTFFRTARDAPLRRLSATMAAAIISA